MSTGPFQGVEKLARISTSNGHGRPGIEQLTPEGRALLPHLSLVLGSGKASPWCLRRCH